MAQFARLSEIYEQPEVMMPIPQAPPPLSWLPHDKELQQTIQHLHEAYCMLAAWRMHSTVVAGMKQARKSHQLYIRNIRWGKRIFLLANLFDTAISLKQKALSGAFFNMTIERELELAVSPSADMQIVALIGAIRGLIASRATTVDLYGVPMPFSLEEAMHAFWQARPYRRQGHANLTKKVKLVGKSYYIKTQQPLASGLTDPERDQRNEAAVAAILNAWRPGIGPSSAYTVLGADGNFFAIIEAVSASEVEDVAQAALAVTQSHVQRAVLAEKVVALIDRHFGNTLIERRKKTLREIDLAPAFLFEQTRRFLSREDLGSLGMVYASHARAIWEAHAETRRHADGSPLFDRAIIEEVVARSSSMQLAATRYLNEAEMSHLIAECERFERTLQKYPGDNISVHEIEQS